MTRLRLNCPPSLFAFLVAANLAAPAIALAEPLADTSHSSGDELFREHCASCHGTNATGNGPMADAQKVPPADLTGISRRAGGIFPAARVVEIITFGGNVSAHGTQTMPVWGKVFSNEGGRGKRGAAASRRAVVALKRYLETIQTK